MLRPIVTPHDSRPDSRLGRRLRVMTTTLVVALAALIFAPATPAFANESETIYSLVNQSRASVGLGALHRNSAMDAVALNWASQLAASGQLAHNPSYSVQIPGGWSTAGENVAQGQPTGSAMHGAWMASPAHKANILGGYTDIGIAFISVGGTTWGVEVFAAYAGSASVGSAPVARSVAPPPATQAANAAAAAATAKATADAAAKAAANAAAQLAAQQAAELAAQHAAQVAAAHAATVLAGAVADRTATGAEARRSEARADSQLSSAALEPAARSSAASAVRDPAALPLIAGLVLISAIGLRLTRARVRRYPGVR